jgi:TonB family protein
MKRRNVFSVKLLSTAIIVSAALFSCTNNDTNDTPAEPKMDTATTAVDTSMNHPSTMTTDTSANKMSDAAATTSKGSAKPNPAKKGLKGKVAVSESNMSKPSGKMEADNTGVYSNVEVLPSFPGGYKGLQKFFDDNLQYPEAASNDGVEGTVNLTFVVDETGKLTSPQVNGENLGYGLEAEALRVVNKMPKWNPGQLKGKNVKTKFTLPVRFELY